MLLTALTGATASMLEGGELPRFLPSATTVVGSVLASLDGVMAVVAFCQLLRIHLCNQQLGWTRQKTFHLMIGLSNTGYVIYFASTILARYKGWLCWSHGCGFMFMACPQILFLATFLLLLSFWVDLCHQASDDDDDDDGSGENSSTEAFLKEKNESGPLHLNARQRCLPLRAGHIGSRQKFVIIVIMLIFLFMLGFTVLIWVGKGKNPIDSSLMAKVYVDVFSIATLLLGGALASYGLMLFSKMSKVRSEMASTEMWKVAGLAAVSLVCFTASALIALISNAPVLFDHQPDDVRTSTVILLFIYYCAGSTMPSAFVLWIMRELPPRQIVGQQARSRVVTFVRDRTQKKDSEVRWAIATSSANQASRASPI